MQEAHIPLLGGPRGPRGNIDQQKAKLSLRCAHSSYLVGEKKKDDYGPLVIAVQRTSKRVGRQAHWPVGKPRRITVLLKVELPYSMHGMGPWAATLASCSHAVQGESEGWTPQAQQADGQDTFSPGSSY